MNPRSHSLVCPRALRAASFTAVCLQRRCREHAALNDENVVLDYLGARRSQYARCGSTRNWKQVWATVVGLQCGAPAASEEPVFKSRAALQHCCASSNARARLNPRTTFTATGRVYAGT